MDHRRFLRYFRDHSSMRFLRARARDAKPVRVILDIFLASSSNFLASEIGFARPSLASLACAKLADPLHKTGLNPLSPRYVWPRIWRKVYFGLRNYEKIRANTRLAYSHNYSSRYNIAFHIYE